MELPALPVLSSAEDRPTSCEGCGACCRRNGSPPLLFNSGLGTAGHHPLRPPGLPAELIAEVDAAFLGLHRGQEPPGPCIWLDAATDRCRHYDWRPQVCRDYAIGSPSCLHDRAEDRRAEDRRADGADPLA